MKSGGRKWLVGALAGGGGIIFLVGLLLLTAEAPPMKDLNKTREALRSAKRSGADKYAFYDFHEAEAFYDSAMACWSAENQRFFFQRNYADMQSYLNQSRQFALKAAAEATQYIQLTRDQLKKRVAKLNKSVDEFERIYKRLPLSEKIVKAHNLGKMKLAEARIAFEENRLQEAGENFKEASELVERSNVAAASQMKQWFSNEGVWRKLHNEAVRLSGAGKKVVLIDKYAHRCLIYQNGNPIRTFDAEFGINWMGDKRYRGDKATPEGIYRVVQKKDMKHTKYHKALLLNYPNDEDKKRFAAEKKKGSLPARVDIGALIEIHGHGGKGVDWTDGCVALHDRDMDVLFDLVATGTPVVIVGSVKSQHDIMNSN